MRDHLPTNLQVEAYSLADLPEFVRALGADPDAVGRRCGVKAEALNQPPGSVSYATYCDLLEAAAEETDLPHFGLAFGSGHGLEVLGWLAQIGWDLANVGERIRVFTRHFNLVSRGELLNLQTGDTEALFVRTPILARYAHCVPAQDVTLAESVQVFRLMLGARWNPAAMYFTHRPADSRPYEAFFRCPLVFDAPLQAIALRATDLASSVSQSLLNSELPVSGGESTESLSVWRKSSSDQVRGAIQIELARGRCNVRQVADRLAMHPRTLHRRLLAENTTYSALLDESRRELAAYFVGDTPLSILEISDLLGYSDATAFSRSFKRWYGSSPLQWRKSRQQNDHSHRCTGRLDEGAGCQR